MKSFSSVLRVVISLLLWDAWPGKLGSLGAKLRGPSLGGARLPAPTSAGQLDSVDVRTAT